MNAWELSGVRAGYGDTDILRNVSFSLPVGRRLAILGPNGSGKTTLLRALAGLLPSTGSIRLLGREIHDMKRGELAREVALMSQFSGISLPYTVEETVLLGRYLHLPKGLFRQPSAHDREVTARCIAASGLTGLEKIPVTQLSGGQLQRVFLARTLAQEPSVILLDEPTSHLDLKYQAELIDYLCGWAKEEGHTLVGVLHDPTLALRLADTFLLLKDGAVAGFGPAEEILRPRLLEQVYGMDVAGYMQAALCRWEEVCHENP